MPHLAPVTSSPLQVTGSSAAETINPDFNAHRENRLDPWTGGVTSNGIIDSDDAQLLVVQVFNLTKYIMTYNQLVYG